jgi:tRNA(Ile)-lysidine synthase
VNHGIRGLEADEDQDFVRELTTRKGVSLTGVGVNVKKIAKEQGLSEEEAGRMVRYQAFYEEYTKHNCNKIAVAHHENDQAETVLFQLFRGSGIKGLAGIPPIRKEIIRPLLCVGRDEIERYLLQHQIVYQIDKTNYEDNYTRNKIRLNMLPYATQQINSKSVSHIARTAGMLREAQEYIEKNAQKKIEQIVSVVNGQYSFDVKQFLDEDIVIQKEILRMLIVRLANQLKDIESEHIHMILSLLEKPVGKRVNLPYGIEAIREYDRIRMIQINKKDKKSNQNNGEDSLFIPVTVPGIVEMSESGIRIRFEILESTDKNRIIPKNNCTKWFDYDKIKNTIFIRNRQNGDFLQIDAAGGHKKLKSYFIDRKIPKEERENVILLADGNHIMWIVGDRISEYYKVREDTTKILKVIIDGGTQYGR